MCRLLIFLCVGLAVLWLGSCDLVQQDLQIPRKYLVRAPKLDLVWLQQSGLHPLGSQHSPSWYWILEYTGSGYYDNAAILRTEEQTGWQLTVELKKRESVLLRAFPQFAEFSKFPRAFDSTKALAKSLLWRPAGAAIMWQAHSDDENGAVRSYQIEATQLGGFHAQVLSDLLSGGFDIRYLNTEKLLYYMEQRMVYQSGDFALNPWDYDLGHLDGELSLLEMDWYDIRLRNTVKTSKMPTGRWQALNLVEPVIDCRSSCDPRLALAVGPHYFWERDLMQLWQFEIQADGEVLAVELLP